MTYRTYTMGIILLSGLATWVSGNPRNTSEVSLTTQEQQSFHLSTQKPESCERRETWRLVGKVMDPASLIQQLRDRESATLELKTLENACARIRELRESNQLTSQRELEAAELQFQLARKHLNETEDALLLEWGQLGESFLGGNMIDLGMQLRSGILRIIHLNLPLAQEIPETAGSVNVWKLGFPTQSQTCTRTFTAPANNQFNAPGIYALLETNTRWPTGQSVIAELSTAKRIGNGWKIPNESVVYKDGAAWVYQQLEENHFQRKLISDRIPEAQFWVIPEAFLDATQPIVVAGAQSLLAKEILTRSTSESSE